METRIKIENGAAALLAELHSAGFKAYAVGGCVRDSLLGLSPHDWDLCTGALPQQVIQLFGEQNTIPTGLKHGTVTVRRGGRLYEITTFRTEGAYSDGRHPDNVSFVSEVEADLSRRDFTINAMAYNAAEGLIDPFGGREDLRRGVVRAVGIPENRFKEDGLRILRLYRFAARFGFALDGATAAAARALAPRLGCVSAERIQEELCRLLCAAKPAAMLDESVFAVILPELGAQSLAEQRRVVDSVPPELSVRLAALLYPLGAEGARAALRRLRCSNALIGSAAVLIEKADIEPASGGRALTTQARRLLGELEINEIRLLSALAAAQRPQRAGEWAALLAEAERQSEANACCRLKQLAVNGGDLMALGIPAGPELKKTLEALLAEVTADRLPNEKAALTQYVKENLA